MSDQKNIPTAELESLLTELRKKQPGYLHCVKAVMNKYALTLREASELVLDSQAFADRRDEIIDNHNAAEAEFFEAMREDNNMKSIHMTFTADDTVCSIETNQR
jgi:DNA repair protein RadC